MAGKGSPDPGHRQKKSLGIGVVAVASVGLMDVDLRRRHNLGLSRIRGLQLDHLLTAAVTHEEKLISAPAALARE